MESFFVFFGPSSQSIALGAGPQIRKARISEPSHIQKKLLKLVETAKASWQGTLTE
jgi:hypothetical protein